MKIMSKERNLFRVLFVSIANNLIMKEYKLNQKQVGKNIKRIREEKGDTQEEFAEGIHASKDTVSNIERGKFFPSVQVLANIAIYAGVSTDQILGLGGDKDNK